MKPCITESWNNYEAEIRGFLSRKVQNARLSEDILQNIFVKALAQGSKFCQLENSRAWLFKVARNELVDHYRREKKHIDFDDEVTEHETEIAAIETLSECLPIAMLKLSEQDKEIITLCDLEGINQSDYAAAKNISLPAAKSRIQRARKQLKQQLHDACQIRFDDSGNVCCYVPCQPTNKQP